MKLTADFTDELKRRNAASDVIGGYVALRRAGSNYVGLCPFHNEKTPSFTVFARSESFYCFGCGAGGDVITFIMKAENLDYMSAVELLAKRAGMTMPIGRDEDLAQLRRRRRILEMNKLAARFFRDALTGGRYPEATEYVAGRGLDGAAGKKFGIGFAPGGYAPLSEYLKEAGYLPNEMKEAFLGAVGKNGRLFDYYRDRIIFPIIDVSSNVVAFGGRTITGDKQKYLNTTDTPAFKKSRNLFAMNFAKSSPADYFILCEGYTDVIALHCAGFTSAVASLGTSLTQEQAMLMKKYKDRVTVCYDGDEAGRKAARRAVPILSSAGLDVRVLLLPGGEDPDEYIKNHGRAGFERLLQTSRGEFDYKSDEILSRYDIDDVEMKIKAAEEFTALLAAIYSDVEREVYTAKAAQLLSVPKQSLAADVAKKRASLLKRSKKDEQNRVFRQTAGYEDRINPQTAGNLRAAHAEQALIGIALLNPEFTKRASDDGTLSAEDYTTDFNRRVYTSIAEAFAAESRFDIAMIGGEYSADEMGRIVQMQIERSRLATNTYEVFRQISGVLKNEKGDETIPPGDGVDDILRLINTKRKDKQ